MAFFLFCACVGCLSKSQSEVASNGYHPLSEFDLVQLPDSGGPVGSDQAVIGSFTEPPAFLTGIVSPIDNPTSSQSVTFAFTTGPTNVADDASLDIETGKIPFGKFGTVNFQAQDTAHLTVSNVRRVTLNSNSDSDTANLLISADPFNLAVGQTSPKKYWITQGIVADVNDASHFLTKIEVTTPLTNAANALSSVTTSPSTSPTTVPNITLSDAHSLQATKVILGVKGWKVTAKQLGPCTNDRHEGIFRLDTPEIHTPLAAEGIPNWLLIERTSQDQVKFDLGVYTSVKTFWSEDSGIFQRLSGGVLHLDPLGHFHVILFCTVGLGGNQYNVLHLWIYRDPNFGNDYVIRGDGYSVYIEQ